MRRIRLFALVVVTGSCGPHFNRDCKDDAYCGQRFEKEGSRCLFNGQTGTSCAYRDTSCSSGLRWVTLAGDNSDQCVPESLVSDGGASAGQGG